MVVGVLGILKAGGRVRAVGSSVLSKDRLGFMLEDSRALVVLIAGRQIAPSIPRFRQTCCAWTLNGKPSVGE